MSWDIFVLNFPPEAKSVDEVPQDFQPTPIGNREEIIRKIKDVIPSTDFSNPSWGIIDGDNFSIEINLGDVEIVKDFAFHVRGGDEAVGTIAAILDKLKIRAFDPQSGDFFKAGDDALKSFQAWRTYRDHVIKDHQPPS
jgi:hypothetical protein